MAQECTIKDLTSKMETEDENQVIIGLPRVWLSMGLWDALKLEDGEPVYVSKLPHEKFYMFLPQKHTGKKKSVYLPSRWQMKFGKVGMKAFVEKYVGKIEDAKRIQIATQPTRKFNPRNLNTQELEEFKGFLLSKLSMSNEVVMGLTQEDTDIKKKVPIKNILWKDYDCIADVVATEPQTESLLRITNETEVYIGVPRLVNVVALFDFSGSINMKLADDKSRKYFMILAGKNLITTKRKSTDDSLISLMFFSSPTSEKARCQIKFVQGLEDKKSRCEISSVDNYLNIQFYEVEWRDMELAFETVLEKQESKHESTDILDPMLLAAKALNRASMAKEGRCSSVIFLFSDGCHNHCMTDGCPTPVDGKVLEKCCMEVKDQVLDYCKNNDIRISALFAARPEEKYTNQKLLEELTRETNGAFLNIAQYIMASGKSQVTEAKVARAVAQFMVNHSSKVDLLIKGTTPKGRQILEISESMVEAAEKEMLRKRLSHLGQDESPDDIEDDA